MHNIGHRKERNAPHRNIGNIEKKIKDLSKIGSEKPMCPMFLCVQKKSYVFKKKHK